ncbi:MAG: chlor-arch-YYY protein [Clostridiales bacterium]|nr:chlor-arch-YYY protein [Clostridiales bacterium]
MDLQYLFIWWAWILILGIISLPMTSMLFSKFFDKGYLFSKTIGILLTSYVLWLVSSMRLLPFARASIWIVLILAAAANIVLFIVMQKNYKALLPTSKHLKFFILEELIFVSALCLWTYIRGFKPEIQGLEKFMDLGFVNSLLRTSYMPPNDMWFAGESINYYYFGHYITAFLTSLTSISSSITYNLMLASLFAFSFALTFSLVANIAILWKKGNFIFSCIAGLISSVLITFSGNLHTFVFTILLPAMKRIGIPINPEIQIPASYWFPDATRYIGYNPSVEDKTIHEFPFYSFVVSDLHAHVINIPFVLTILALILMLLINATDDIKENSPLPKIWKFPPQLFVITFLIGIFQMSNFWDFPIYLTVTGIILLYINLLRFNFSLKSWIYTAIQGVVIFAASMLVALPFSLNFASMTNGIGQTHSSSPFYQLMVLWCYQIFFVVCFICLIFREKWHISHTSSHLRNHIGTENSTSHSISVKLANVLKDLSPADMFVLVLSLSAVGLVLIPEVVYVKDIYVGAYYRSNTMFKLTYQSFIMFSLVIGYIFIRLLLVKRTLVKQLAVGLSLCIVLTLPMLYPSYAVNGWYGEIKTERYKGIDGLNFLQKQFPDDYKAVQWLNENIKGQPVVLEADGLSYTDYGRISMSTGLPTIQGWETHEWLWRNSKAKVDERKKEVAGIYESGDLDATKTLLKKYDVEYIVIGKLEFDKFKNIKESKLLSLGKVVFNSPSTRIIRIEVK